MNALNYLLPGLLGFFVSATLIRVMLPFCLRWGLVDHPGGRKKHRRPVALCGGVAIFFGFTVGILAAGLVSTSEGIALVLGGLGVLALGVYDDAKGSSVRLRFLAQAALIVLFMIGIARTRIVDVGNLFAAGSLSLGWFSIPFTVFCVMGVMNALNMIDGVDGLAGGVSVIALLGLGILSLAGGNAQGALFTLILAGSVAGFLVYNFPFRRSSSAKAFLGDGGSLFLGFVIAWFAIELSQGPLCPVCPMAAVWLLALPIADTLRVFVRRAWRGRNPFTPRHDHLHHVLLSFGFSKRATVSVMLMLSSALAAVGVMSELFYLSESDLFYGALLVFAAYCVVIEVLRSSRRSALIARRAAPRVIERRVWQVGQLQD